MFKKIKHILQSESDRNILLISVFLSMICSYVLFKPAQNIDNAQNMVQVWVSQQSLPKNAHISNNQLYLKEFPKAVLPHNVIKEEDLQLVQDKHTLHMIAADTPLLKSSFISKKTHKHKSALIQEHTYSTMAQVDFNLLENSTRIDIFFTNIKQNSSVLLIKNALMIKKQANNQDFENQTAYQDNEYSLNGFKKSQIWLKLSHFESRLLDYAAMKGHFTLKKTIYKGNRYKPKFIKHLKKLSHMHLINDRIFQEHLHMLNPALDQMNIKIYHPKVSL